MRNTLRVTAATAAGALAFTMLASTAQADEDDPTPSAPSITAPASVDRLMPIEINGTDFDPEDKVTVVATQVNPDEGSEAFIVEEPATVNSSGNIPRLQEPEEGQRVFVEVPTDNSWPIGDYKVRAEIVGDDGQVGSTAPVDVSVKRGKAALGVGLSVDGKARTKVNTDEKLSVTGFWPEVPAGTEVAVSVHRRGMSAPVVNFDKKVGFENDGFVDNEFELPSALAEGSYMFQFQVVKEAYDPETDTTDSTADVFARTALDVVAPPPPPDPEPEEPTDPEPEEPTDPETPTDPPPSPQPEPEPQPQPEKPNPQPPVIQKPTAPPVVNEVPPTTKKPAKVTEKKAVAKVQTPDVIVGAADGDTEDKAKADKQGEVDAPEAADPRASIPGEGELEASPQLTFGDKDKDEVTLSAAPKSESVPMTPLLMVLGLMAALGGGAAFALRKFRV